MSDDAVTEKQMQKKAVRPTRSIFLSEFTAKRHRVEVLLLANALSFVVQTETFSFGEHRMDPYFCTEFLVHNVTSLPEATRMIRHFVGYFEDEELVAHALEGLRMTVDALRVPPVLVVSIDATKLHVGTA